MTLALIEGTTVLRLVVPGTGFNLPNGDRVSPAEDGWDNGAQRLALILDAEPVPDGKQIVSTDCQLIAGVPQWVHVLEDIPVVAFPDLEPWQFETLVQFLQIDADIEAAIAAIADPMQRAAAWSRRHKSLSYRRADPLFDQLADDPNVSMTSDQLNAAWAQAAALVA